MLTIKGRLAIVSFVAVLCASVFALGTRADGTRTGDPTRGAKIYDRCVACHSLDRNRTGPKHCGLIGRRAGSVAGFDYSKAMRNSGIVWNRDSLDEFLRAPLKSMPGTKMGYAGIKDPQARSDLIAFLASATDGAEGCR